MKASPGFGRSDTASTVVGATIAVLLCASLLSLAATQKPAGAQDASQCSADEEIRLLMLFDVSGSLKRTDPEARRRDGGLLALNDLQKLQERYRDVAMWMTIDSFGTVYEAGQWLPASNDRLRQRVTSVGSRDNAGFTDYRQALDGAFERLSGVSPDVCKRIFWFTDGTHDTDKNSGPAVTAAESAQIDELCADGGAAARLTGQGVEVTAVNLAGGDARQAPETLRRLYGKGDSACANPLLGEIIHVSDIADLASRLRESIADGAFEAVEQIPASNACDSVDTADTEASGGVCEFTFDLDLSDKSFKIFIDLKNLVDPDAILIYLRRPTDEALLPVAFADAEQIHPQTGFLAQAGTSNWKQLTGHQAAAFSSRFTSDEWVWEGTWTIAFHGDGSSLARVTRPVVTTKGLPKLNPVIYADNRLSGQVSLPPTENESEFAGVVRLSLDAPGHDLHGWRLEPVEGHAVERGSWSAPGVSHMVAAVPEMTAHLQSTSGAVGLRAQLVEFVDYGGETDIHWEVPEAHYVVTVQMAHAAWERDGGLHPAVTDVAVAEDEGLAPTGDFLVSVVPGRRDGVLHLESVIATADGERVPLEPTESMASWECIVPSGEQTADARESSPASGGACPLIRIQPRVDDDVIADFVFEFTSTLVEESALREDAAAQGLSDQATKYDAITTTVVRPDVDIRVINADDTWRWFALLTAFAIALALGARIIVAHQLRRWEPLDNENDRAFAAQVLLVGDQFVLADGTPLAGSTGEPAQGVKQRLVPAFDLTKSQSRASVGTGKGAVRLRSTWGRPLLGGTPRIIASPSSGGDVCIAANGKTRRRRGDVGRKLRNGWALSRQHGGVGEASFVVWDLPRDPAEAAGRIEAAERDAIRECERSQFFGSMSTAESSDPVQQERPVEPGGEGPVDPLPQTQRSQPDAVARDPLTPDTDDVFD